MNTLTARLLVALPGMFFSLVANAQGLAQDCAEAYQAASLEVQGDQVQTRPGDVHVVGKEISRTDVRIWIVAQTRDRHSKLREIEVSCPLADDGIDRKRLNRELLELWEKRVELRKQRQEQNFEELPPLPDLHSPD